MLTIAGNGMGDYNFSNIDLDFEQFDKIICDKNFKEDRKNLLKLGYREAKNYILENYTSQNILYVVTGSPLFFSAGTIIASLIDKKYLKIINNSSSKDYCLATLGIDESKVNYFSLHGRKNIDLTKFLTNQYTFILCDKDTISKIQKAIKYLKANDIEIFIGFLLGYKSQKIQTINIFEKINFDLTKPYVLLIKKLFTTPKSRDENFVTERGMITKEYKRNLSLQNLDLEPNKIFWDIGAGSGSCGIEAYKRYRVKTVFFEKNSLRVQNIKQNLSNHFVVDCKLLEGEATDFFETIAENPDRIFVGGGGEKVIKKLSYLYERLEVEGIMLINIITLKHLSLTITILNESKIKYEIFSLSLTAYKGNLDLVEPERQLFQIKIRKNP